MKTLIGGAELIELGGNILKNGGLVAFPTETVYGLGANAFDEKAVNSIFTAKGRPQDNPLIVHVSSPDDITKAAQNVPDAAYELFERFSPGPLTLVLEKRPELPLVVTGGLNTVGVRIPRHPLATALLKSAGVPVAAPSANSSGRVSPTEAEHVYEDMNGKIPLIIDGGKTEVGIESTVLDMTKKVPVVLRPGYYTAEMLGEVLGKVVNHKGEIVIAEAPGMKYKHYAPVCGAIGSENRSAAIREYDRTVHRNPVIIGSDEFIAECGERNVISLGATPPEITSNLFSTLRAAEKKYGYIILQWFEDTPEYYAVNNRAKKATGGIKL